MKRWTPIFISSHPECRACDGTGLNDLERNYRASIESLSYWNRHPGHLPECWVCKGSGKQKLTEGKP